MTKIRKVEDKNEDNDRKVFFRFVSLEFVGEEREKLWDKGNRELTN